MNEFLTYMIEKLGRGEPPTPTNIAWNIAPKVNAVFRNGSAEDKENLFRGFVGEIGTDEALKIATRCHRQQSTIVKEVFEKCDKDCIIRQNFVCAFIENEHKEYTGLIAAKFMSKYNKPAFVLRKADPMNYSGSFRSTVPILDLINSSGLASGRGHSVAAGIFIKACNLEKFFVWLDEQELLGLAEKTEVTACLLPSQITVDLCKACENNNALWGNGVPEPTWFVSAIIAKCNIQVFEKRTTTVKITVDSVDFLLFMAKPEQVESLNFDGKKRIKMIVTLSTNEYMGNVSPQGKIKQFEISDIQDNWADAF